MCGLQPASCRLCLASDILPPYLDIKWESVGCPRSSFLLHHNFSFISASENRSAGRGYGVYEPNIDFIANIQKYLHNRFLNIGGSCVDYYLNGHH